VVARQLSSLLGVRSKHGSDVVAALRIGREAADRGEGSFADRLARELDTFWLHGLSRTWPTVAARAGEDIALRTRLLADHGMAGALGSLHDDVCYGDGALRLFDRHVPRFPSTDLSFSSPRLGRTTGC